MRDEAIHQLLLAEQQRLEPDRARAEARHVLAMDLKKRAAYLAEVEQARGKEAGAVLRAAVEGEK